ncbi:T9SS type B sorting domain-containing protein [Flavobacterium sp. JAS]|uniref:T9SS type B sorting domain-containing protein n=1 Tax=Flavobacterium sp. JAS TaxID=2897329 RepID=UPI001E57854B|nr:choice-of-anchor L domain-containing protein [Flavobacterium sp. JAS]MCD0471333.1 T9SS type B sorting domain-containing protein [Flavobacterium sp. JAS]
MNRLKHLLVILFLCCLSSKINAQYISIDDQKTPQELIETILVNSSCASASNTSGKGDTFTPGKNSFGYFNAGTSEFPFSEGIVLTTSTSTEGIGPYVSNLGSGNPNWLGDSDLNQILGITSINATSIEFDFVALTDILSFNYIFASNEYQYDFPCTYSDGFAFLIKEANTSNPYQNIAVLPGTTTPVSSVNVRPTIEPGQVPPPITRSYPGCPAANQIYFNGINDINSPINYTGQTVIMNAQTNVITGKTYHIKLVVADAGQRYYDSAVFLQAGSFASKITFGQDRTTASNNPVCFGETLLLDPKLSSAYSYKWYKNNVQIATTPTFTATDAGTYRVEVTLTPSTCSLVGEIKIEYAPEILSTGTPLIQCDDNTDGISIFNLTKVDNIIKNNVSEITNNGYYESLADAQNKTNPILTPEKYTNKTPNQIVYGRIENKYGCYKTPKVTLQISTATISNQSPVATCDKDDKQDGFYQFDLESEVTPQVLAGLPNGLVANYFLTQNDAITETNKLSSPFKNTTAFNQTIYVRVINGPDCYNVTPITLVVNTFDPPNFKDESKTICKGVTTTLAVATGFSSYLWNTGSTNNHIDVNAAGDYSVTVKDANGCDKTKKFKIIASEPATITDVVIKDFSGTDNSALIQYTGAGNYEFSIDGMAYQDNPLFTGVKPGMYNATARDKNGCGISGIFVFYVLDYPRFFTPNGDGYNDLWFIKDFDQLPAYKLSIFDRYGKLLKQMDQNSLGWNGIYNSQQLPSDDYWFTLILENGTGIKGHFSLKR